MEPLGLCRSPKGAQPPSTLGPTACLVGLRVEPVLTNHSSYNRAMMEPLIPAYLSILVSALVPIVAGSHSSLTVSNTGQSIEQRMSSMLTGRRLIA